MVRVFLFPRSSLECTTCLACAGTCMLQWGELRRWFLITIHHHAPVQINIFFACFFVHSLQRHAHEGQTRANVSLAILLGKTTYSTAWQLHHQHSPAANSRILSGAVAVERGDNGNHERSGCHARWRGL